MANPFKFPVIAAQWNTNRWDVELLHFNTDMLSNGVQEMHLKCCTAQCFNLIKDFTKERL